MYEKLMRSDKGGARGGLERKKKEDRMMKGKESGRDSEGRRWRVRGRRGRVRRARDRELQNKK